MQVTKPRRRPVHRPGPSQIAMCGFCRLFRVMMPETRIFARTARKTKAEGFNWFTISLFPFLNSKGTQLGGTTCVVRNVPVSSSEVQNLQKKMSFRKEFGRDVQKCAPSQQPNSACETITMPLLVSTRIHKNKSIHHHTLGSGTTKFQVT